MSGNPPLLTRYVTSCKTMEPWEEWLGLGGGLLLEFSFQFDRENMSIFSCAAGYDVFVACCFQWDCARGGRVFYRSATSRTVTCFYTLNFLFTRGNVQR